MLHELVHRGVRKPVAVVLISVTGPISSRIKLCTSRGVEVLRDAVVVYLAVDGGP
jgi:hypothetical protein